MKKSPKAKSLSWLESQFSDQSILKLTITRAHWKSISSEDRFALLLLGQIFNEIMILQKLMFTSHPNSEENPQFHAMSGQKQFMDRLTAGKIYEAHKVINSKSIKSFLTKSCFPALGEEDGKSLLKDFNQKVSGCKWLSGARNKHSMHFPSHQEWEAAINYLEKQKIGYSQFIGKTQAQNYYFASAQTALIAFYLDSGCDESHESATKLHDELLQLCASLLNLIRISTLAFMESLINSNNKIATIKNTKKFTKPAMKDFKIPYFFDTTDLKSSTKSGE
ncbi:hypothetical protein [Burkholderia cepacia]|uniref:hypothetical protein n=1 Tax=Burkholderia cepacia TaxID=292 RepID=UPI00158A3A90|nr:hypothetical protein [Burkholderia cepacia]